jgi:hypothetical protein
MMLMCLARSPFFLFKKKSRNSSTYSIPFVLTPLLLLLLLPFFIVNCVLMTFSFVFAEV